jgi:hypothetical protein
VVFLSVASGIRIYLIHLIIFTLSAALAESKGDHWGLGRSPKKLKNLFLFHEVMPQCKMASVLLYNTMRLLKKTAHLP